MPQDQILLQRMTPGFEDCTQTPERGVNHANSGPRGLAERADRPTQSVPDEVLATHSPVGESFPPLAVSTLKHQSASAFPDSH